MAPTLLLIGMLLIATGFAIIAIAFLIELLRSTKRKGEVEKRGGAVVMVGPFPIILASDPKTAKALLMLAIMLTIIILVALTILSYGLSRLG
ncbi:MAG: TIGR00304 family membrane protein [Thermoproteota archaeon]